MLPLFTAMTALSIAAPKPDPKQFGWFTDYPAAKAEANRIESKSPFFIEGIRLKVMRKL